MAEKILTFSFLFTISSLLIAISILGIYGVLILIRNDGLKGPLSESIRAYFVSRRLKLRYKGLAADRVVKNDGERGVSTYFHSRGGCNSSLYRGITRVDGLYCRKFSLELGSSILYCPRCEVIVGLISEVSTPGPQKVEKKGPLGIVR